jgi:hypothetical protein
VRFDAAKVGLDEDVGDDFTVSALYARPLEHVDDEMLEFLFGREKVF